MSSLVQIRKPESGEADAARKEEALLARLAGVPFPADRGFGRSGFRVSGVGRASGVWARMRFR